MFSIVIRLIGLKTFKTLDQDKLKIIPTKNINTQNKVLVQNFLGAQNLVIINSFRFSSLFDTFESHGFDLNFNNDKINVHFSSQILNLTFAIPFFYQSQTPSKL